MTDRVGRQQGTMSDYVARNAKALRRHARVAATGFDPNEDPVIIGSGATAGGGSTPSAPSAGNSGSVVLGLNASDGGTGESVVIGAGAATSGVVMAVAVGQGSQCQRDYGVAVGYHANADSTNGIAIGKSAKTISGTGGIAIGNLADVEDSSSIAIGVSATVLHASAVALGVNAATTVANQIMLGAATSFVEVAKYSATYGSIVVMQSPNGTRYALQVSNAGAFSVIASPV